MIKHNLKKLFYLLFLTLGIISCRQQDGLLEAQNDEKTFNLFNKNNSYQSKDSQNNSSLGKSYASDFLQAFYSYDLKNGTNYTGLNVKAPAPNSYINFRVHSQRIENKEGNVYMYFPVMKNDKVSDIYFAIINRENTILGLYKLKNTEQEYNNIYSAFERVFDHAYNNIHSRGQGVNEIDEVVITGPSNPSDDMGVIGPGQCEMYGQCNNGGGSGGTGGGGGGGGGGNGTPTISLSPPPPPELPINDIEKFLSCLDSSKPANLTVYAQKMFGGNGVGHAFISISQGSNTMTFGFYPKNGFPLSVTGPGQMGDDGGHPYNTAWNVGNITSAQLQNIMAAAVTYSNSIYDVGFNNCVDWTMAALHYAGIEFMWQGIDTPTSFSNTIEPSATSTNGNAPQTKRTCK